MAVYELISNTKTDVFIKLWISINMQPGTLNSQMWKAVDGQHDSLILWLQNRHRRKRANESFMELDEKKPGISCNKTVSCCSSLWKQELVQVLCKQTGASKNKLPNLSSTSPSDGSSLQSWILTNCSGHWSDNALRNLVAQKRLVKFLLLSMC